MKVKWETCDKDLYVALINSEMNSINIEQNSTGMLDNELVKLNQILTASATVAALNENK